MLRQRKKNEINIYRNAMWRPTAVYLHAFAWQDRNFRRTNNKLNPHMESKPGFEPGQLWWEASTTLVSLASLFAKTRALEGTPVDSNTPEGA